MRIVFFDTETTGLIDQNPEVEITEYAGATWDDGEVSGEFHRYVVPQLGMPPEIAKINGYSEELWRSRGACHWNLTDCNELKSRLDGMLMGGSNPGFDQAMVRREFARAGVPVPDWSHRKLDTNALGYPLVAAGIVDKTSLVVLAKHFGIEHAAHTAMGDVLASIKVWEAIYDLYLYQPKIMREALVEIANDAAAKGDVDLEEYARNVSEGIDDNE